MLFSSIAWLHKKRTKQIPQTTRSYLFHGLVRQHVQDGNKKLVHHGFGMRFHRNQSRLNEKASQSMRHCTTATNNLSSLRDSLFSPIAVKSLSFQTRKNYLFDSLKVLLHLHLSMQRSHESSSKRITDSHLVNKILNTFLLLFFFFFLHSTFA